MSNNSRSIESQPWTSVHLGKINNKRKSLYPAENAAILDIFWHVRAQTPKTVFTGTWETVYFFFQFLSISFVLLCFPSFLFGGLKCVPLEFQFLTERKFWRNLARRDRVPFTRLQSKQLETTSDDKVNQKIGAACRTDRKKACGVFIFCTGISDCMLEKCDLPRVSFDFPEEDSTNIVILFTLSKEVCVYIISTENFQKF